VQVIVLSNRQHRYLAETLTSITEHVAGVDRLTIVDDSGDATWRAFLRRLGAEVVAVDEQPAGYARAMQTVLSTAEGEHFALWEEDFRATGSIDLEAIARTLDEREHLAQIALLRQPWFGNEVAAGGVLEAHAQGNEIELVDGVFEHRAFFTTNPTVLPRRTFSRPWPDGDWSESRFGQELLRDASVKFGMVPGVRLEHVGERTGFGY
jgi:hypothetical protein